MKVLTAEQMAYVDRKTIEGGTPGIDLMRNAGSAVYDLITEIAATDKNSRIVVLAGKGNNGGDGFRVSELLARGKYESSVYLAGRTADVRGDAAACMNDAVRAGQVIREIESADDLEYLSKNLKSTDIIVDALFGTGLRGEITGLPASIIDMVNDSEATVVAVDIPSGVNSTTGDIAVHTIQADYTLTFGSLKVGHVCMPGRHACGDINVVDIGFSSEVMDSVESIAHTLTSVEAADYLPKRPFDAHKGSTGRVFLIAGSVGMTGAAALASSTAMRV